MPKLKADGTTGKVAIWTGGSDDAPLTDPLANLSRLLFHSDLAYPTITQKVTGSITLPATTAGHSVSRTLFAHGLAGTPWVMGRVTTAGGQVISLGGSVPIYIRAASSYGLARWITLGANATNVLLHDYAENTTPSPIVLTYDILVTDLLL